MTRSHIKPTKQGNKNSRGEGVSKKLRVEGFGKQYRGWGFQGVRNLLSTMTEVEMNDFNKIIGRNVVTQAIKSNIKCPKAINTIKTFKFISLTRFNC